MVESNYCMYTVNSPIFGLDDDLSAFLNEFVNLGSPRFSDFAALWKKRRFIELIYGRRTQSSLKDILEGIFFYLTKNFTGLSDLQRIGSIYIIYAFYGKQPIEKLARVNVTPSAWNALSGAMKRLEKDHQWDAYYIFRRLCVQSAFRFVANEEELYPGVPLYTRSNISLPTRRTFLTKVQRKLLTIANKGKSMRSCQPNVVPSRFLVLPEHLKTNWNAIFMAASRYIEAKDKVSKVSGPSNIGDPLWSLDLVNYRESVAPISDMLKQFSDETNRPYEDSTEMDEEVKPNSDDIGKRRRIRLQTRSMATDIINMQYCGCEWFKANGCTVRQCSGNNAKLDYMLPAL
ncbi:snRNA-activating protein complex subunit 1 [Taenia crassiceps]|uniref:snRNA-activating protein complex subunit 1 n=1 Tax=Taenia crassiceps TaxID=6207 RepID=A0ABR4QSG1_9CEST